MLLKIQQSLIDPCSFIRIWLFFRPPSQHQEVNRRRRHTNILLGCITAVFFICWGPLEFYVILFEFKPSILPERTSGASVGYTLSLLVGLLTPIANPLFYGLLNDSFQEVMKEKCPWMFSSSSVIGNLTIQSLALSLPAMPKWNRIKVTIDENNHQGPILYQTEFAVAATFLFCALNTLSKLCWLIICQGEILFRVLYHTNSYFEP